MRSASLMLALLAGCTNIYGFPRRSNEDARYGLVTPLFFPAAQCRSSGPIMGVLLGRGIRDWSVRPGPLRQAFVLGVCEEFP